MLDEEVIVESDGDVPPSFFDAFEGTLEPPYRVVAVRKEGPRWALGARRLDVVRLPEDFEPDRIELAVHHGEERVTVDGDSVLGSNRALFESLRVLRGLAQERGFRDFVADAERLDGPVWEVRVAPL